MKLTGHICSVLTGRTPAVAAAEFCREGRVILLMLSLPACLQPSDTQPALQQTDGEQ
jgi:hypothetical protein